MLSPAWFSRVGRPLLTRERCDARALAEAFAAVVRVPIEEVRSWRTLEAVVRAEPSDDPWWDGEESERQRLWQLAAERQSEASLAGRMAAIVDERAPPIRVAVAACAARAGGADPALLRTAVGAALLAEQQYALAELAGVDREHHFAIKRRAFAGGRWPVGYHRGAFLYF